MTSDNRKIPDTEYKTPRYPISHAVGRLGGTPNATTIREYIKCDLLSPFRDSLGRFLFSDADLDVIRKHQQQRAQRIGRAIHRVTSTSRG
jgi:DNA-binding transcriptional MerR regulator